MKDLNVQLPTEVTQQITQKLAAEILAERMRLYQEMLTSHPLFALAAANELPREIVDEFAYLQYADSILWVPMLALMKERVQNSSLLRALRDNLACEAGIESLSHVELARRFISSLGIRDARPGFDRPDVIESASHWTAFSEGQIAGWIYASETLVPILFAGMKPCYERIEGCDLAYLQEHIGVDTNEHSIWMREAIFDLLQSGTKLQEVLTGMDLGMRECFDVPDRLYAKAMWLRRFIF